jgi:hypothetical protein
MFTWLGQFLESLLLISPFFLVYLVAAILALNRWRRHRRVSLLTLFSIGLSVTVALVCCFLLAWLPDILWPYPLGTYDQALKERVVLNRVIVMISNVLWAVALAMLVAAVFIDRSGKKRLQSLGMDPSAFTNKHTLNRISENLQ